MPYASTKDLPAAVKKLPSHAQQIFKSAFNAAYEKYGEERAFKIAWSAVAKYKHKDSVMPIRDTATAVIDRNSKYKPRKTVDGNLVCNARVARTGIQIYKGSEVGDPRDEVRIWRPESEVFSRDSFNTFAHRPITLGHPHKDWVAPENWQKHAVGHSDGEIVRDGEFVRIPMLLLDAKAIKSVDEGHTKEVSVGYTAELEWQDGVTPAGEKYDAVQRNIRVNHIALVHTARGGHHLRVGDQTTEDLMKKVMVDGIELQMEETDAAIVQRALDRAGQELAAAKRDQQHTDDLRKQVETKDGEIAALKQQLKDATKSPEEIDRMVAARAETLGRAARVLGDSDKLIGKSDAEIRRAVVTHKLGDTAKNMSDAAIEGAFTALTLEPTTSNGNGNGSGGTSQLARVLYQATDSRQSTLADERDRAWEERGEWQRNAWKAQ